MPLSNHFQAFNAEHSPTRAMFRYQEPFERTYMTDSYAVSPDNSLSTFFDKDSFFAHSSAIPEKRPWCPPPETQSFRPTLPVTSTAPTSDQCDQTAYFVPTSEQVQDYVPWSVFNPAAVDLAESASFSPTTQTSSRAPSLCDDVQQQPQSPSGSSHFIKQESPSAFASPEQQAIPRRPSNKRSRPCLDLLDTKFPPTGRSSTRSVRPGRLPHNQIERKYREGLNSELERLRKAVPSLSQSEEATTGQVKPSKGMILSSAIDYIKTIERERDALREEIEHFKQVQRESWSWTGGRNSLDDFLAELK